MVPTSSLPWMTRARRPLPKQRHLQLSALPWYAGTLAWSRGPWEATLGGYGVGSCEGLGLNKGLGSGILDQLHGQNLKAPGFLGTTCSTAVRQYNDETSANAGLQPAVATCLTIAATYKRHG